MTSKKENISSNIHIFKFCLNITSASWACNLLQLKKYYQPRKSHRIVSVNVEGTKVPLYGAGSTITVSQTGVEVPLTLSFEIRSRGYVVGKLVKTKHHKEITCPLVLNSSGSKPIKFKRNSCTYDWSIYVNFQSSSVLRLQLKIIWSMVCAYLQIRGSIWFAREAKYAMGKYFLHTTSSPESPSVLYSYMSLVLINACKFVYAYA